MRVWIYSLILSSFFMVAQASSSGNGLNKSAMEKALAALKAKDRAALAQIIRYPYLRPKPLSALVNAEAFLQGYSEFFNEAAEKEAIRGLERDLKLKNVRGTGRLQFAAGKIVAMEPIAKVRDALVKKAEHADLAQLNVLAKGYDELVFDCKTEERHVRLERFKEVYKIFVWKKGETLSEVPEVAIAVRKMSGSAGIVTYQFTLGEGAHELSDNKPVCSDEMKDKKTGDCLATFDEKFCL